MSDQDRLKNEGVFWRYYYYIIALRELENEQIQEQLKKQRHASHEITTPKQFVPESFYPDDELFQNWLSDLNPQEHAEIKANELELVGFYSLEDKKKKEKESNKMNELRKKMEDL